MGATIPPMQRVVNEYAAGLQAEIDGLAQSLADGHNEMNTYNTAVRRWQEQYTGDPPGTARFRREIEGSWDMGVDIHSVAPREHPILDSIIEPLNPEQCHKFEANEFGNCINLSWCFRVFGVELKCQQTRKEVIPKPMKEHRKLEVD